jgi:hypothetical protein
MCKRRVGKEGAAKRLLIFSFVLAGFALLAQPASAGTITVGWDLMTDPSVTAYRVYVGTSPKVYTETFDVPADKDFFIFRNAFMGRRYYFAVAAQFDNAKFGPPSLEVSAVGTRTVGGSLGGGVRVPDSTLASDCGADCFVVTELARGLGEISSVAVAGDGTVFAVESARRVVVLRGGAPLTAFEAEPGAVLRDLALDPQFATTGRVFVSMVRAHDRSSGDLEVVRLRYLAGSLGEPSTIVSGPTVPLGAAAPLAVGDDALVYVALPALLARHPYSAAVVAFDQDGRAAGTRGPVVARAFEQPLDIAWDAQNRAVWVIGRNSGADVQLVSVSAAGAAPVISNALAAGESAAGLAVASGAARRLLVAAGVDLIEEAPGAADSLRISLETHGAPVAVAAGAGGRYAATRNDDSGTVTYRVVKVEDGVGRAAR